jgi:hypothetical protein
LPQAVVYTNVRLSEVNPMPVPAPPMVYVGGEPEAYEYVPAIPVEKSICCHGTDWAIAAGLDSITSTMAIIVAQINLSKQSRNLPCAADSVVLKVFMALPSSDAVSGKLVSMAASI